MKRFMLFILLCSTSSAFARSWNGTSTTWGRTTYHEFHSNEITVLPAPAPRCHCDNGAAIAGGIVAGACLGILIGNYMESYKQKRDENRLAIEMRNKIYVDEMISTYNTSQHFEYVDCIQKSALPIDTKMIVIHHFEKIKYGY